MNKFKVINTVILLLFATAVPGVQAACTGEIEDVATMLNFGDSTGSYVGICAEGGSLDGARNEERICNGLNGKLTSAVEKMDQGKVADADKKLANFEETIGSLAFRKKAKISMTDYSNLNGSLQTARACVTPLLPVE